MSNTKHFKLTYSKNHCGNNSWCFLAYKCEECACFIIFSCSSRYDSVSSQLLSTNQYATSMSFLENDSPQIGSSNGQAIWAKNESFSFFTPPPLLRGGRLKVVSTSFKYIPQNVSASYATQACIMDHSGFVLFRTLFFKSSRNLPKENDTIHILLIVIYLILIIKKDEEYIPFYWIHPSKVDWSSKQCLLW